MPHSLLGALPPRGLLRVAARLPIWCYRWRLGWLLGNRFLLLTHTGRRSGRPRHVVLEVVRRDPASGVCIVASGWGEASDWHRNLRKTPAVTVHFGRRQFAARAECLAPAETEAELREYARDHPHAFRAIARLLTGQRVAGTEQDFRRLRESVPMVALRPIPAGAAHREIGAR